MKFSFLLALSCFALVVFSQNSPVLPAYRRFPTIPPLQLLRSDSSKYTKEDIPKKKPVLIVMFSPDCEHCQHEAEQLVAQKEAFKNIHIIMATTYPLERMNTFAETYGLLQMENVVMAKDPYYMLPSFFEMHMFPYLALYNKKGNLIATFEGGAAPDKILAAFDENK